MNKVKLVGFSCIAGTICIVAVKGAAFMPAKQSATSPAPVTVVGVATATNRPFVRHIVLTGTITARDELPIAAQANGLQIKSVLVEEGDSVKKGQILAVLDNAVLKAQIAEESANLASASATYKKSLQPNTSEEIAGQQAAVSAALSAIERSNFDVEKARSEYKNAAAIQKRYEYLHKEGGASDEETEQKRTNAESASASLSASLKSLEEAKQSAKQATEKLHQYSRGGRSEDVAIAQASVAQHRARAEELAAQLAQTYVRAPADGLITERAAHVGDVSSSAKTLFKLARGNEVEMIGNVSQDDLKTVHIGQAVEVVNGKDYTTGKVWLVSPTVDSQSRLGKIHVSVPVTKGFLQGMFATATIKNTAENKLVVPEASVVSEAAQNYVFRCIGNICHKNYVRTGERSDGYVEILQGLNANDLVVTDGVTLISDNQAIRPSQALDVVLQ